MEIILTIIAGAIISGLNIGCFALGVLWEKKRPKQEAYTFDEATKQAIKDSAEWSNF